MRFAVFSGAAVLAIAGGLAVYHWSSPEEELDVASPPRAFNGCTTCHVIRAPDGTLHAGRDARTGPNLFRKYGPYRKNP